MTEPLKWRKVAKLQPYALGLYANARIARRRRWFAIWDKHKPKEPFCLNEQYYDRFKPEIVKNFGRQAQTTDEWLMSSEVYEMVCERIFHALPSCDGCGCMSPELDKGAEDYYSQVAQHHYDLRDPKIKRSEFASVKKTEQFKNEMQSKLFVQNYSCYYCKTPIESYPSTSLNRGTVHSDHIIPLTRGGSNDSVNIVVCCMRCNSSKGNDIYDYRVEVDPRYSHVFGRLTWKRIVSFMHY